MLLIQIFQGRNHSNFWVAYLENWCLHKFILTLSDLDEVEERPKGLDCHLNEVLSETNECNLVWAAFLVENLTQKWKSL